MNIFEKILKHKSSKISNGNILPEPICIHDFVANIETIMHEWRNFKIKEGKNLKPIDEYSLDQKNLNQDKKWLALFLYGYKFYNNYNEKYFPITTQIIKKWEKHITMVMFSTLEPGMHILPHKGRNFGVLRTQIGIDIREHKNTGLKVNDCIVNIAEKEVFTFDDTNLHEAWNFGNTSRTVLIIDTVKKLSLIYNLINYFLQRKIRKSDYIVNTINNIKKQIKV